MDFQKVADAIERAPQEVKDLLFSEETGTFLNELAATNGLNEELTLKMIDEVGYVVLGLKEMSGFKSALSNAGIDKSIVLDLITSINREIFSKLDKTESTVSSPASESPALPPVPAPNNLPMVEAGEVAHDVPHVEQVVEKAPVAETQPAEANVLASAATTEEKTTAPQPTRITHYPGGVDPYREPIE